MHMTCSSPSGEPLIAAPAGAQTMAFDARTLSAARVFVTCEAVAAGVAPSRRQDLELAVSELATNSVRHGGGVGTLRAWREGDAFVCEVRDRGMFADPLAGRALPAFDAVGGYGLWIVRQLCDVVEVRALASGTVVRIRIDVRERQAPRVASRQASVRRSGSSRSPYTPCTPS